MDICFATDLANLDDRPVFRRLMDGGLWIVGIKVTLDHLDIRQLELRQAAQLEALTGYRRYTSARRSVSNFVR